MTEDHKYRVLVETRAISGWQRLCDKYPDKMTDFQKFIKTHTRQIQELLMAKSRNSKAD